MTTTIDTAEINRMAKMYFADQLPPDSIEGVGKQFEAALYQRLMIARQRAYEAGNKKAASKIYTIMYHVLPTLYKKEQEHKAKLAMKARIVR